MKFNFPFKEIFITLTILTLPSIAAACPGDPSSGRCITLERLGISTDTRPGRESVVTSYSSVSMGHAAEDLSPEERAVVTSYLEWNISQMNHLSSAAPLYGRRDTARVWEAWAQLQSILYQVAATDRSSIVGVGQNGIETTIYCNPGQCTFGSVTRHALTNGLPMMVAKTLLDGLTANPAISHGGDAAIDAGFGADVDGPWAATAALMTTSGVLSTDTNANAAAHIHPITMMLAAARRSVFLQNQQNQQATGALDTTTGDTDTTTGDTDTTTGDTDTTTADSTPPSDDPGNPDSSLPDPYLTGDYVWPARPHVCNAVDSGGMSLCP